MNPRFNPAHIERMMIAVIFIIGEQSFPSFALWALDSSCAPAMLLTMGRRVSILALWTSNSYRSPTMALACFNAWRISIPILIEEAHSATSLMVVQ